MAGIAVLASASPTGNLFQSRPKVSANPADIIGEPEYPFHLLAGIIGHGFTSKRKGNEFMINPQPHVKVRVYTTSYRIDGKIAQFSNERLTDYMVSAKSFLAMTETTVHSPEGRLLFSSRFLDVNRDRIEIIVPHEELD